jgi:hypothetical protein
VKASRFEEVARELEDPHIWETPERAQQQKKKKKQLEMVVDSFAGSTGRSRTLPSCSSWPGARRTTRR